LKLFGEAGSRSVSFMSRFLEREDRAGVLLKSQIVTSKTLEQNEGSPRILCMEIAKVEGLIHVVRGHRVMLDSDLATIYGVMTKRLNQQVLRNVGRFPEDFMFRLTAEETGRLMSQIATSKIGRGGRRKLPLVFTQEGVAMLSSVLHSPRAIQANIAIIF